MYLPHLYIAFHFILFILTFIITDIELALISLAIFHTVLSQTKYQLLAKRGRSLLLPLALSFLVVLRLSFHIISPIFYCYLHSCTLGPLHNKLLNCTDFSLELLTLF